MKKITYFYLLLLIVTLPFGADSQGTVNLLEKNFVPADVDTSSIVDYAGFVFTTALFAAVGLAVLMITIGGVRYIMSDSITDKGGAKKQITNAIWGLILAFGAYLILNTINPALIKWDSTGVPGINGQNSTSAPLNPAN